MDGQYRVQGKSLSALADEYDTPLYVYDGHVMVNTFRSLQECLSNEFEFFYSLKANPNLSVYALLQQLGARAEVSSLTELEIAIRAGTPAENIIFLGPGKSMTELIACIDYGIYAIVCESFGELEQIERLAQQRGRIVDVALRINPAFTVKGSRLTMGGKPRQFGIDEEQVLEQLPLVRSYRHIRMLGVHVYMGTRILEADVIAQNTEKIFALTRRVEQRLGYTLDMVDIGGGLGVPYFDQEQELDVVSLANKLNPLVESFRGDHPHTRIIMELGRYLVGMSGILVTRVRYKKDSFGETFLIVDGGTHCHMAAVGIGSFVKRNFPIRHVEKYQCDPTHSYHITGPLCTPNDQIGKAVMLPEVEVGDLLGLFHSGAYGPTASPVLFLSHGFPAEVMVYKGEAFLIRERDTTADMLRKQRLLDGMKVEANTRR
ncbi:diaminopimelate decarboxylase [Mechercharimyces sp. CAU 1602]|uniref:diaminopimelate decarboxylase n=1 Tax=Mechercharimyces sp. CAU 1602 TaxID=2973933 RepID=UPI002161F185|nr:diaminopimelate decarboxylase [Mechercharimyces sp. CAU 1602]MCS1352491.1 diaminopimelate decarboxylase [Mechercharimyces sp. CAU 1602]